jgi:general secretion pathway protein G
MLMLLFAAPLTVAAQTLSDAEERAVSAVAGIRLALDMFYTDCGHYPTTREGLRALLAEPKSGCRSWGPDPYIQNIPADPWNRRWRYRSDGKNYEIRSLGADGREGGEGEDMDISFRGSVDGAAISE